MITEGRYKRSLFSLLITGIALGFLSFLALDAAAQSGDPSAFCHVTDGAFTLCPDGNAEWSDVTPQFFPESQSYLYADQADLDPNLASPNSPVDTFMLLYDECGRTTPFGPDEYFRVSFTTVEVEDGVEKLEHYVIHIFTDGTIIFFEDGELETDGEGNFRVEEIEGQRGKVGFGPSPNCPFDHVIAEFEIGLTAAEVIVDGAYSPDPQFWGAAPPCDFKCALTRAATVKAAIAANICLAAALGCAACVVPCAVCAAVAANAAAVAVLDPPDPNFMVFAVPNSPLFTPIAPSPGVTQEAADALNALLNNQTQTLGLMDAWLASIERAQGAAVAGDDSFEAQQLQAAAQFSTELADLFEAEPALTANAQAALLNGGFSPIPITSSNIAAFQADVAVNGLSSFIVVHPAGDSTTGSRTCGDSRSPHRTRSGSSSSRAARPSGSACRPHAASRADSEDSSPPPGAAPSSSRLGNILKGATIPAPVRFSAAR